MLRHYLVKLLLFGMFSSAFALGSLSVDEVGAQQLFSNKMIQNNNISELNASHIAWESTISSARESHKGMGLDKEDNLFNPDGTIGVTKDAKMLVNPNGVNFKLGY